MCELNNLHSAHVLISLSSPRSIGDFFTWGPVVTDNAYYREVRLRPGPLANVTVRQPIEALNELQRMNVPVIMGTKTFSVVRIVHMDFLT